MKKMSKKELRLVTGGQIDDTIARYCLNPNTHMQCIYDNNGDLIGAVPSICKGFCMI